MSAAPAELVLVADAAPAPHAVCPAAACAERIANLEADVDALERAITRELAAISFAPMEDALLRLHALETRRDAALMQGDATRTELSTLEAATCAGAAAQLLAAIRDIRINDAEERVRARELERQARRFFAASGVLTPNAARALSQTAMR